MDIIEINHLCKSFGNVKAVQDLSFKVKEGELFAFLGVNGAGKSTTIGIICGVLNKDKGDVIINGYDIDNDIMSIKNDLGVVFQYSTLDLSLSVLDNLACRAALYNITGKQFNERLEEISNLLDLKSIIKRPLKKLSGGQRRRIDIARAIFHEPKILILDEPTTGLDPQTRKTIWKAIDYLKKEKNMTVFLTTHYMEEASDADHVIILDSGKIVAEGTPISLKNQYSGDFITIYNQKEDVIKELNLPYEKINEAFRIEVSNTKVATELIIKYPEIFTDYEIVKGKMDDVFLSVTGKKLLGGEK